MLLTNSKVAISSRLRALHFCYASRHLATQATLRRSYLYVPASSDRTLQKSLTTNSDILIYDLEDSVPPTAQDKDTARKRLSDFLDVRSLAKSEEHKSNIPQGGDPTRAGESCGPGQ